jgi:phage gp37-like protein
MAKWIDKNVGEEVKTSTLFKFKVKIGERVVEVDMTTDIEVDYDLIQDQLQETPSMFVYWAAIYSEMKSQCLALERAIKARRGKLIDEAIRGAQQAGVKLTDKALTAIVEADEELNLLENRSIIANKHAGKLYFMIEAIRMKSDNLRSLSGFRRLELEQS